MKDEKNPISFFKAAKCCTNICVRSLQSNNNNDNHPQPKYATLFFIETISPKNLDTTSFIIKQTLQLFICANFPQFRQFKMSHNI